MEEDNKIVKWIMSSNIKRWLLFLPLALLSAIIVSFIHQFLFTLAFDVESTKSGIWYYLLFIPTNALLTGASLIYVATFIVPIKNTSIILITFLIIFFIFGEFINDGLLEYGIFYILGSLLGRYLAIAEDNNN
jgi:hypothetical protein